MRALFTAVGLLTRAPVPHFPASAQDLGRSAVFFPPVGAIVGLLLAGVNLAAGWLWHSDAAGAALVITASVLVTGGLHLDGLMDTCDGVFSGYPRERALEIMRDSRVGAFGVMGAACLVLLKFAFLVSLRGELQWRTLVMMAMAGRWAMLWAAFLFPAARQEGLGRDFKTHLAPWHLGLATAIAAAIGAAVLGPPAVAPLALAWLTAWALGLGLTRRLGGLTGDSYGAIAEVAEVVVLAAAPLVAGWGWVRTLH